MKQVFIASKEVLSKRFYLLTFLGLVPFVFMLFVLIPVWTIPGNSLEFQLSIFTQRDYVLLSILSLLTSLFLVIQLFILKSSVHVGSKVSIVGRSGAGGSLAVIGSVFATASCSACLFGLLGFLGANTVFFLAERQWYVASGAILLLLISLYFVSKKVNGICESCRID